jgi:hypothetical protein
MVSGLMLVRRPSAIRSIRSCPIGSHAPSGPSPTNPRRSPLLPNGNARSQKKKRQRTIPSMCSCLLLFFSRILWIGSTTTNRRSPSATAEVLRLASTCSPPQGPRKRHRSATGAHHSSLPTTCPREDRPDTGTSKTP